MNKLKHKNRILYQDAQNPEILLKDLFGHLETVSKFMTTKMHTYVTDEKDTETWAKLALEAIYKEWPDIDSEQVEQACTLLVTFIVIKRLHESIEVLRDTMEVPKKLMALTFPYIDQIKMATKKKDN